ncbi:MAG: hypothetical protein Q8O78_06580 [Candidatus Deferrimicrobium sp.]|nr:hypothetical protein [Candidatus Deferrimicrobium sp.]
MDRPPFVDVHSHVVPSGDDGASGVGEGEVRERVMADPKIREYTTGKEIRKTVYVPGKLFSIVVS